MSIGIRRKGPGYWVNRTLFYGLVAVILIYIMFPFYWAIRTAMSTDSDVYATPVQYWPQNPTFDHFINALTDTDFLRAILNSVIVGVSATLLSLLVGALGAYALGRFNFPGRPLARYLILAMSMFPQVSILGALYQVASATHLYNTLYALIITYLVFTLPFTVWTLASFFQTMPRELEEASYVDGATPMTTFWRVMLPLAAPGLATTAILAIIGAWNEFLFALSFTLTQDHWTVPVAIVNIGKTQTSAYQIPWGDQMAATLVVMAPLIAAVLILQRRIISGLTGGAVKG